MKLYLTIKYLRLKRKKNAEIRELIDCLRNYAASQHVNTGFCDLYKENLTSQNYLQKQMTQLIRLRHILKIVKNETYYGFNQTQEEDFTGFN